MKRERLKFIINVFVAGLVPTFFIMYILRVSEIDLSIPATLGGDEYLIAVLLKSIKENGIMGLWFNDRIGAPGISSLIDTPFMDYPLAFLSWVIVNIFSNINEAIYICYFLTYFLAGATGYVMFAKVSRNRLLSIVFAVIFSLLPYHFLRGTSHITLSNYYNLALGMCVIYDVYNESFERGFPCRCSNNILGKIGFVVQMLLAALGNIYYSFFIMFSVLVAIITKAIKNKQWKTFINEGRVLGTMVIMFLAGILPKVLYGIVNGNNSMAAIRQPLEAELYSLKIIQMLLPPSYSKVPWLAAINRTYSANAININENSAACLGFAGIIGFSIACVVVFLSLFRHKKIEKEISDYILYMSMMILILVLFGSAGGFGTIFSYFVTAQLRCYNRASIVIDAFCLQILLLLLCKVCEYGHQKVASVCTLVILGIVMICDVPARNVNAYQETIKVKDAQYKTFFGNVEREVKEQGMIYQLPVMEFPESPMVVNLTDYAHFRGYLYTDKLRWSYGSVKGRDDANAKLYVDEGMSYEFISNIIDAGFSGIYIDTDGYEDAGKEIIEFYNNVIGQSPIVSEDGKLYFYKVDDSSEAHEEYRLNYDSYRMSRKNKEILRAFSIYVNDEELYDVEDSDDIYDILGFEKGMPTRTYVSVLYEKMLKRTASVAEVDDWVQKIEEGMTLKEVFVAFYDSEEINMLH